MSFRGRMNNRGRGGRNGRGGRGGGRMNRPYNTGPPEKVIEAGTLSHICEGEAIINLTIDKIPMFNAHIFLENKTQIGKVEEIFGLINNTLFTVKMLPGVKAESFNKGDKFYIDPFKLLPKERFLEQEEDKTKSIQQKPTRRGGKNTKNRGNSGGTRGGIRGGRGGGGGGRSFHKSGGIFKK